MARDGPERRNPLAPYYPSDVPDFGGSDRHWGTIVLLAVILFGAILTLVSIVAGL